MPRMTAELVLSALYESDDTGVDVTAIAVTDQRIVAVGRAADRSPLELVSSDARHFQPCAAPRQAPWDGLAVGGAARGAVRRPRGRRFGLGMRRARPARRVARWRRALADARHGHHRLP